MYADDRYRVKSVLSGSKNMDFFLTNEPSFIVEEKKPGFLKSFINFRFLNLLILSISFLLVFGGYNISQNFMTSVHGDVGSISLGIVYFFFSICNLIAPTLIKILGTKICIPIGLAIYILYVLASAAPTPISKAGFFSDFYSSLYNVYKCFDDVDQQNIVQNCLMERTTQFAIQNYGALLIFLASPLLGFGAALTWASQGAYVTALAYDPVSEKTETGFYSGTFFSIYQSNLIVGNLLVIGLLYLEIPIVYIFLSMFVIALIGTIISAFLWPYANNQSKDGKDKNGKPKKRQYHDIEMDDRDSFAPRGFLGGIASAATIVADDNESMVKKIMFKILAKTVGILNDTKDSLLGTASVLIDKRMILMFPLCVYSGMTGAYFCGALPAATMNKTWICCAFTSFGVAEILCSVSFGKAIDLLGRRIMLYVTIAIHAISIVLSLSPIYFLTGRPVVTYDENNVKIVTTEGFPATILLSYFMWGLADAALNTSLYSIIPAKSMFSDKIAAGFSVMKLCQALAASVMFVVNMFFKDLLLVFQIVLTVLLILGTICCILLECLFVKFDGKSKKGEDDFETPSEDESFVQKIKNKILGILPENLKDKLNLPNLPNLPFGNQERGSSKNPIFEGVSNQMSRIGKLKKFTSI